MATWTLAFLGAGLAGDAGSQVITEFPIPTVARPAGITAGPDGNVWFTEAGFGGSSIARIGRITTDGVVTEFEIPTAGSDPLGITAGPDGNLWFTENAANQIGRISPAGVITEFAIPTFDSLPRDITAGPDGNLWFTEFRNIGRITTAGVVIDEFPVPPIPVGIVAGPDGNVWFTDDSGRGRIGRISTAGVVTEFSLSSDSTFCCPLSIAAGPDGNLWFTGGTAIGRITPTGAITEFDIPPGQLINGSVGIAAGPDGSLWFTQQESSQVARITTAGVITEFQTPTQGALPDSIAAGPDGNLWFTENNLIGRIGLSAFCGTGRGHVRPRSPIPYFPCVYGRP